MAKSKGKKKIRKNKKKVVIKPDLTVKPVTTPDGSVHFDEFLRVCKEPKLPPVLAEPITKKSKKKSKKGKKSNKKVKGKKKKAKKLKKKGKKGKKGKLSKKVVKKVEVITPSLLNETDSYPNLFPLTMALFKPPTDDDTFADNTLFPEFVVGKTEPPVLRNQASIQELNIMEQQANKTVEEINRVQEKIRSMMQKPNLNDSEAAELENHNLLLVVLLKDFENSLAKMINIYHTERAEIEGNQLNENDDDEDGWFDIAEEECLEKKEIAESRRTHECDKVESKSDITNVTKWYEAADLAYLLPPNTSFNKRTSQSVSSGLLRIFDVLKDEDKKLSEKNEKRGKVFQRLKNKFNIQLPPPKSNGTKVNLEQMDEQLHKDHQTMLNATKNLKIFQSWNQLELKYNIVDALIISLKDAIKSTSPYFYASSDVKSKFLADQSVLVQSLDEFKRETSRTFKEAGLADYWKLHPKSIRLDSPSGFDVTICRRVAEIDHIVPLEKPRLSFLQRGLFNTKYDKCKRVTKINSKDSEIEVDMINY